MLRAQKNVSFNNGHRNQRTNIFYQKIFKSMDHSLAMNYFASLGIFMRQRHSRTEVTKSLEIVTNFSKDVEVFLVAGIWDTRTTGFIMLTLIYVISTALLSAESQTFLLAKRPQWRGARRNGCFRRLQTDLTKNKDFIAAFKMFRRF